MVRSKECFKCNIEKPLTEFYKHLAMSDGHLNKCKDCTKSDALRHRLENSEKLKAYDQKRAMLPHRVLARLKYAKTERGKQVIACLHKRWRDENQLKRKAQNMVNNALRDGKITKPDICGCGRAGRIEGHHDDYAKPLEVRWLCVPCHREVHK